MLIKAILNDCNRFKAFVYTENKVKVTMRKSYGFRTYKAAEIALYHTLGALPEPKMTHSFY